MLPELISLPAGRYIPGNVRFWEEAVAEPDKDLCSDSESLRNLTRGSSSRIVVMGSERRDSRRHLEVGRKPGSGDENASDCRRNLTSWIGTTSAAALGRRPGGHMPAIDCFRIGYAESQSCALLSSPVRRYQAARRDLSTMRGH